MGQAGVGRRTSIGRRIVAAAGAAAVAAGAFAAQSLTHAQPAAADPAPVNHLVISEVNGDQSGVYRTNWVELYNPTASAIDLGRLDTSSSPAKVTANYFLCLAGQSSSTCSTPYRLYGTVLAHHHFLVELYDAGGTLPAWPAGVTPDLDFASTDVTVNPSLQAAKNIGGYSTGGQVLLLDAAADKTGAYPTTGVDPDSTYSTTDRNLGDASINPSPVVDAMGYTPASTASALAGTEGWQSTTDLHAAPVQDASHWDVRKFDGDDPQDTNDNAADFEVGQRDPISQVSSRVALAPIADATISRNEAIAPITAHGTRGVGTLTYSATGLPAGIAIDPATGVISGTPDADDALAGYRVGVTVTDQTPGTPDTVTASFTMTLSAALRVDPIADTSVTKGAAMPPIQVHAHGGTPSYSYTATGLPTGVGVDAATGIISGTPTDTAGKYPVHVTVTDSGTGTGAGAQQSTSVDFTLTEDPAPPAQGDPLSGLRINEVKATASPSDDWVELYNTGAAVTGASVDLTDDSGKIFHATGLSVAHGGYAVIEGADLHAAGLDLTASDTLSLRETGDQTELDRTTWTVFEPTSWARTVDGTGSFAVSAYATKGAPNSGPPTIKPNDLLISEVNYDNNSTDYYEYSEITNTTDHPIDFAAYGLTLAKSGTTMTLHDSSDTTSASPTVDPVIPAHGTQVFWWVETQYYGVKTTKQFLTNYNLPATTPVVLVFGFSSLANSGGDHSYDLTVNQGTTPISQAWVDTPCAANTYNGSSTCTATNGNYAEHYALPADRSDAVAAVWYDSLHVGGDDIDYPLKPPLFSPGTIDLEQVGYTRAVTITAAKGNSLTLYNASDAAVDLSGYVLRKDSAGPDYTLPVGTTVAPNADLVVTARVSGLRFAGHDYATLLAPRGYAYSDGVGLVFTTGPLLHTLAYDANSGQPPVIDPTTGLPLPPAGGLYRPAGVSARAGTVYASNTGDNVLAAVAGGSNTIIAGSLASNTFDPSQDGGPATDAGLYQPGGSAVDANGNVFLADSGDNVILEITKADGKIHLIAGTGTAGGSGATITAGSTGKTVNLYYPQAVAIAPRGGVYVADTFDNRVIEVSAAGRVSVVAGTGQAGYTGDGHAAREATLSQPAGLAVDRKGDLYIADSANNVVRRVDAGSGVITTVAGDYAADQADDSCLGAFSGDGGPATSAQLNDPQGIAVDGAGNLFIADTFNNAVREVATDGTISTTVNASAVAGPEYTSPTGSGVIPTNTQLNTPSAVGLDPTTNTLYIADTRNNELAQVEHVAQSGNHAGPVEPAREVKVTGSGVAFAACDALANPPVISEVSPAAGPTAGGTKVTLTGTHFDGTTGVEFGSVAASEFTVVDDKHLAVIAPPGTPGRVDVTVTNAAGTSSVAAADGFTYLTAPTITGVSPASGWFTGGTTVTITGTRLGGVTSVRFGTTAARHVTVVDDSHLQVLTPAHAPGRVDVVVAGPGGSSTVGTADRFTFTRAGAR